MEMFLPQSGGLCSESLNKMVCCKEKKNIIRVIVSLSLCWVYMILVFVCGRPASDSTDLSEVESRSYDLAKRGPGGVPNSYCHNQPVGGIENRELYPA